MTIDFQLQYMRQKSLEQKQQDLKHRKGMDFNNHKLDKSVQTRFSTIPNMRDAYSAVRNSGHIPSEGEIHYRRFTSGSYVDISPSKK